MARLISNLDLFAAYARFGRGSQISLRDTSAIEDFASHVKAQVTDAVLNPIVIHGQRAQNMFEAMMIGFGGYRLLKVEDGGRYHPEEDFEVPDFRIVLSNGDMLLVEVKNHYGKDPFKQTAKFKSDYLKRMSEYSKLVGCQLRIAIYWARWGFWTLTDPEDLAANESNSTISMTDAMRVSEMARLGDVTIGTKAPLKFRMVADQSKPRFIENGQANITICQVQLFCDQSEIIDENDKRLVWLLMQFGDWETEPPTAIMDGDLVDALECQWSPQQASDDQGFDMIGTASTIFSRYFALNTTSGGEILQTEIEPVPDWLAPILSDRPTSDALPIWKFFLQPNRQRRAT